MENHITIPAPKYVLAIDFDGTIFDTDYPTIGPVREDAVKIIRTFWNEGYGIIINTCREGLALSAAINALMIAGIPYHYVNSNFPHLIYKYSADTRKISADLYIDDKCLMGLPSWQEIYEIVTQKREEWDTLEASILEESKE